MPQLGPAEVLVILVVALLVFGPKRLPEVGRQVGRGLRELRKVQDTVRDEINSVIHHDAEDDEPPSYASAPRPALPAVGTGRPAPSRFRPAATPSADTTDASPTAASPPPPRWPAAKDRTAAAPARGAHAPSRFRAPGA